MTGKISPIRDLAPKDIKPRQVVSYETSSLFANKGAIERYNPDDLATRKGLGIYKKMMDDEQVKAVVSFRAASILARGFEFMYNQDDDLVPEEKERRIKFFEHCVRTMRGSFQDALRQVLRAHLQGFSLTEKVFDTTIFEGQPMLGIGQLLPRAAEQFRFFTDEYGTLVRCEQQIGNKQHNVDLSKFLHHVCAPEEDRYYGQSDLRAAHRAWYVKDVTIKLYATYLERFAGGFAYATLPSESTIGEGHAEYEALQTAMSNIRNLSSLILPPGVTLEVLQPGTTGEYREALTYMDLAIAKAVLVPNLLGLSHTGSTGAYAQSQTQLEAYFMTTAADTARLEDTLNEQLFKDLGDINFGDGQYPRFTFKPASIEQVKWMVTTFKELSSAGAIQTTETDEKYLRKLLDMPARTEDDKLMAETQLEIDEQRMQVQAKHATPGKEEKFTWRGLDAILAARDRKLMTGIRHSFGFNPDQPRQPAGSSDGGQFAPASGGGGGDVSSRTALGQLPTGDKRGLSAWKVDGYQRKDLDDYVRLARAIVRDGTRLRLDRDFIDTARDFLHHATRTTLDSYKGFKDPSSTYDREMKDRVDWLMGLAETEMTRFSLDHRFAFDPDQPRDPGGPGGGQWIKDGSEGEEGLQVSNDLNWVAGVREGSGWSPEKTRDRAQKLLDKYESKGSDYEPERVALHRAIEISKAPPYAGQNLDMREPLLALADEAKEVWATSDYLRNLMEHEQRVEQRGWRSKEGRFSQYSINENYAHGQPRSVDQITFTRAVARVDFALIEHRSQFLEADGVERAAQATAKALRRALEPTRVAEYLADPERVGGFTFEGSDVGKIKASLAETLRQSWEHGLGSAARELRKAGREQPEMFARNIRDKAAEYFESNAFRMAANLTDGMRATIQQELLSAIKNGTRVEEVVPRILDRLIRKGFTTLDAVSREAPGPDLVERLGEILADALGTADVPAYLNTLVRTNTFEALNEARLSAFEDPDLAGFVVAYEYSAVLDSSTTEICQEMDDTIYSRDSDVWERFVPPNHYNCRSLLVAITAIDGWDGVDSPPPTVEPQEGFK